MIYSQRKNNALAGPELAETILSLHVNHNLQSDAEKMAYAADTAATRFNAAHFELRVPWGEPPFPPRPQMGTDASEAIETVARTARYRLMFDAMLRQRVNVLATGHHADDQIETVLMRLGSGSSVLGLGGMRPVRRFGMAMSKGENDFGWFGHEGLDRWIARPLLDVPKVRNRARSRRRLVFFTVYFFFQDRILATCELHDIRYVLDPTNFQPDLTLRNAIRHVLVNNEKKRDSALVPVVRLSPLYDHIESSLTLRIFLL